MKRYLAAASAAMISLALASPISAQDLGLKQLQDSAVSSMAQLNMDTSMVDVLTLEELTRIQGITSGDFAPNEKVAHIETVLREADERIAAGGAVVPSGPAGDLNMGDLDSTTDIRHSVRAEIAELGLNGEIDVDALSDDQVMQIHLITQNTSNTSEQRVQIQNIVAN